MPCTIYLCSFAQAVLLMLAAYCGGNVSVSVDFSSAAHEPPLSKSLLGVYQTPFWFKSHAPGGKDCLQMVKLLQQAGIHDLRYELAWGKPDAFNAQAKGLDPFLKQLEAAEISPLLVLGYCPTVLQRQPDSWQRWKDEPRDLDSWRNICRDFADRTAHHFHLPGLAFEVWNEPDLLGDGGKVFFDGDAAAYGRIYNAAALAVRSGAANSAVIGGPAIAYDSKYVTASGILKGPIDFVSIHAYANAPSQLRNLRLAFPERHLPIRLTEYASYSTDGLAHSNSHYASAAAFFNDVKELLTEPDLKKVYWAQWVDDSIGMLDESLHRRALYNAFLAYQTLLPANRCSIQLDDGDVMDGMAAVESGAAAVVLWNKTQSEQAVVVKLSGLSGSHGEARLFRIDAKHSSYGDEAATEELKPVERWNCKGASSSWSGALPGQAVLLLRIDTDR